MIALWIVGSVVSGFVGWFVLGLIGTFFYGLGWWPIGAFFNLSSSLTLLGGIGGAIYALFLAISGKLRST